MAPCICLHRFHSLKDQVLGLCEQQKRLRAPAFNMPLHIEAASTTQQDASQSCMQGSVGRLAPLMTEGRGTPPHRGSSGWPAAGPKADPAKPLLMVCGSTACDCCCAGIAVSVKLKLPHASFSMSMSIELLLLLFACTS